MKTISIGAAMTGLAVILGAFGTHMLRGKIGFDLFEIYQTGTYYLTIHALGTVLYGIWHQLFSSSGQSMERREVRPWPAWAFWLGSLIFSGSLYCITFTAIRGFGMLTPVGGVLLIAGWAGFALQAGRKHS